MRYRQDDDQRSGHYDELLAAETRAIKKAVGIHSKKQPPVIRVADISGVSGWIFCRKIARFKYIFFYNCTKFRLLTCMLKNNAKTCIVPESSETAAQRHIKTKRLGNLENGIQS